LYFFVEYAIEKLVHRDSHILPVAWWQTWWKGIRKCFLDD